MKVLFLTNYPAPYRVDFFNMLGQKVELTVAFTDNPEMQAHRSAKWFIDDYSSFHAVFLKDKQQIGKIKICRDVISLLQKQYDQIIFGGYSTGTQMYAIEYLRRKKIPFAIEADGGMVKEESLISYRIKRHFIGSANAWLSTGTVTTDYFLHYGAKKESIYLYPLSSQKKSEIVMAREFLNEFSEKPNTKNQLSENELSLHRKIISEKLLDIKRLAQETLKIKESRVILFVGQLIYRKGIDVLLHAAKYIPNDIAVLIVGGKPTEEYLSIKKELQLDHVYFEDFLVKKDLEKYYRAADLFVMPTREDIWGLVINEAMSYGLPIVSTDRCVAAMELVENNVNGLIVPADDADALAKGIMHVLSADLREMGQQSMKKISGYTIEKMVEAHMDFFEKMKRKKD